MEGSKQAEREKNASIIHGIFSGIFRCKDQKTYITKCKIYFTNTCTRRYRYWQYSDTNTEPRTATKPICPRAAELHTSAGKVHSFSPSGVSGGSLPYFFCLFSRVSTLGIRRTRYPTQRVSQCRIILFRCKNEFLYFQ
jgi:hypothetical protein